MKHTRVLIESSLFSKYLIDNIYTYGIKDVEEQIRELFQRSLPTTVLHNMARHIKREINWSTNTTRARVKLSAVNLVYDQNLVLKGDMTPGRL